MDLPDDGQEPRPRRDHGISWAATRLRGLTGRPPIREPPPGGAPSRPPAAAPRSGGDLVPLLQSRGIVALGVVAALGVLVAAAGSATRGLVVGCYLSGAVAFASGALVVRRGRRADVGARLPMTLFGAAIVTWGVGQGLVGLYLHVGDHRFPTPADWISTLAAPLAIVGLLAMRRRMSGPASWIRLTLDSAVLGASLSLVIWRLGFLGVLFAGGDVAQDASILAMMIFEVTVVALLLLAWLRDLDRELLVVVAGMALFVVADASSLRGLVVTGAWPGWTGALWCLAWSVVASGLLRFDLVRGRRADPYRSEARVTTVTSLTAVVILVLSLAEGGHTGQLDTVSVALASWVLVLFAGRELYGSWQRQNLVLRLARDALHDSLTGLRNRRALGTAMESVNRRGGSVLTLDLDGFKEVNDVLGHDRGDALLVAVSRRLESVLEQDCLPYRTGGDEFAVLAPGDRRGAGDLAEDLLHAVRAAAADVPGVSAIGVSGSVGVSTRAPRAHADARAEDRAADGDALELLAESGAAMSAAKRAGKDRVKIFDGAVAEAHRRGLLLERRLRDALSERCLTVAYQPVVSVRSRRVIGFEALARWHDDVLGDVPPDEFIPVAEKCGLIGRLGGQVAQRAVREFAQAGAVLDTLHLSVNVSAAQLRQPQEVDALLELVRSRGLDPRRFIVEVTESTFVDFADPALRSLERLRHAGVSVAIDDFGSGYSALGYLSRVPANVVKVDRSLTLNAADDVRSGRVLRAVVDLASTMPADVVVEGIETTAQLEIVRAAGATYGQGWLFSPPVGIGGALDLVGPQVVGVPGQAGPGTASVTGRG